MVALAPPESGAEAVDMRGASAAAAPPNLPAEADEVPPAADNRRP